MSRIDKFVPYLNVPLSNNYFTVNTQDSITGDANGFIAPNSKSPYDITIQKFESLFSGPVQRVQLTELNMPYISSNVNYYNDVLFLTNEAGTTTLVPILADGFYTGTALATLIQTALNSGGGVFGLTTWTCIYNVAPRGVDGSMQGTFTINSGVPALEEGMEPEEGIVYATPNERFRVNPMIGKFKGVSLSSPGQAIQRSSTLAFVMGFEQAGVLSGGYAVKQISGFAPMVYTTYFDIVSSQMCKFQNRDSSTSNLTGKNLVARVYVAPQGNFDYFASDNTQQIIGTRPFNIHQYFSNSKFIKWSKDEYLSNLNIKLIDQFGNILYAPYVNFSPAPPVGTGEFSYDGWVEMTFNISEVDT